MVKKIALVGSTGSIGRNTLDVVRQFPDRFKLVALAAGSNDKSIAEQAAEFKPEAVCLSDKKAADRLRPQLSNGIRLLAGPEGLRELAACTGADLVIAASSGSSSLLPVLDAIRAKKDIGIANKELLVMAGCLVTAEAKKAGIRLLPVDSEHNAIFQCLAAAGNPEEVRRILLTGSGGPLKDMPYEDFKGLKPEFVIRHPRWNMGPKISVDSATLMNKGLEFIEACWLFDVGPEKIRVLIHPQAVVHSMVEFTDGSVIAQMGNTDMKLPLAHVMHYPERADWPSMAPEPVSWENLTFADPDMEKFPCLGYAMEAAARRDGTLSAVLNAVDEVAVSAFLEGKIDFTEIPEIIRKVLRAHENRKADSLAVILDADHWARGEAQGFCHRKTSEKKCSHS